MDVSGQIHALTALFIGNSTGCLLKKKLGGSKNFRKEEKFSCLPEIERRFPRRPNFCLATVPDTKETVH
jgi:hypothetical protein